MKVTDTNENQIFVKDLEELSLAIEHLELKKKAQEQGMKDTFEGIKESFTPKNLVKSAYNKLTEDQTPLQIGLKVAAVIATALIAKKALSPNEEPKHYVKNDEEEMIEVQPKETSLFTKFALTAAANYVISKIPVVTAYTAAAVNQIVKKED
jgi:hypothetical protein